MVEFLPMSTAVYEEMLRFVLTKTEDPELKKRQKLMVKVAFEMTPELEAEVKAEGRLEGRLEGQLEEARSALRRVLTRRKLALTADDDARIDACTDLGMLDRWLEQAVDAPSAAEALR